MGEIQKMFGIFDKIDITYAKFFKNVCKYRKCYKNVEQIL